MRVGQIARNPEPGRQYAARRSSIHILQTIQPLIRVVNHAAPSLSKRFGSGFYGARLKTLEVATFAFAGQFSPGLNVNVTAFGLSSTTIEKPQMFR
jgi:hypothetical protein